MILAIDIPTSALHELCESYGVRRLALFGSVLRDDFKGDSDIDILVMFEPGHTPGFGMVTLQDELSELLGRRVDLRTKAELSPYFREDVERRAKVLYERA